MNVTATITILGLVIGFLETFSIWFVPNEAYASFIVAAGTIKGGLAALLISRWVDGSSTIGKALGVGSAVGFLMALVVYLAKGGWVSGDAPFVLPSGFVTGLLIGAGVRYLGRPRAESDDDA
jgi:hypothetical protein